MKEENDFYNLAQFNLMRFVELSEFKEKQQESKAFLYEATETRQSELSFLTRI